MQNKKGRGSMTTQGSGKRSDGEVSLTPLYVLMGM